MGSGSHCPAPHPALPEAGGVGRLRRPAAPGGGTGVPPLGNVDGAQQALHGGHAAVLGVWCVGAALLWGVGALLRDV